MKKRSKIGWAGLFLATVAFLVGKNYLDAKFFDGLNIFHKTEAEQPVVPAAPDNVSNMSGSSKTILQQAADAAQETPSLRVDVLRQTANAGDAQAQYALGMLYLQGEDISEDRAQALVWLRRAAENGSVPAAAKLKALGEP